MVLKYREEFPLVVPDEAIKTKLMSALQAYQNRPAAPFSKSKD
jgi:hypothetical protein